MFKLTSRRIFFFCLLILFAITFPLILFYTWGYRFSWNRGIFIYTGSISIKSSPSNINIFLNKKSVSRKKINYLNNSFLVDGLLPGEYLLDIKADGYNLWNKKITVHSGMTTEFWNVILTRQFYERTAYPVTDIKKIFFSPDNKKIACLKEIDGEIIVEILELNDKTAINIFSSREYKFPQEREENIEWSPDSQKILIPIEKNGSLGYFYVNIKTGNSANLKDLFQQKEFYSARWNNQKENQLFFISEEKLFVADLNKPKEEKEIFAYVAAYDFSGSSLLILNSQNGIVYQIDSEGRNPKQITSSSPNEKFGEKARLIAYDKKRIAFLNKEGDLYIYNQTEKEKYFRKLGSAVHSVQFSNDGKKLLFWTDQEIFVYFLRDWETQPRRHENELKMITRFSQTIREAQWNESYEHILFSLGTSIKIVELDDREAPLIMDIVNLKTATPLLLANFSQNKLYFADKETSDQKNDQLYSINFPESNNLFIR